MPTSKASTPSSPPKITGTQFATAFDGKLEPKRISVGYGLSLLVVTAFMLLMPVVYLAIIAATAWGVQWYAVHASVMLQAARYGRVAIVILAIYVAPIIAGVTLILFMILPLFWRSRKSRLKPMWVDRREQPLLYAYIDNLCDAMGTPRPARIDLLPNANASAHIDNGVLGLFRRRMVLTIGLPLPAAMNLRQFTGVIAHEFGHFRQGLFMRLSWLVTSINRWFFRLAYQRNGLDDMLASTAQQHDSVLVALIAGLTQLCMFFARLILKSLALISHALSMRLSRHAEFDADHQSARIVGSDSAAAALEMVPFLDIASTTAMSRAEAAWKRRSLPDDLVMVTDILHHHLPSDLRGKVEAQILAADARWFDTHPPLFKRIGVLKKAKLKGVLKLDAPATVLFKDFDELCKLSTISFYQDALGDALQPEYLQPVSMSAADATPPAVKPSRRA